MTITLVHPRRTTKDVVLVSDFDIVQDPWLGIAMRSTKSTSRGACRRSEVLNLVKSTLYPRLKLVRKHDFGIDVMAIRNREYWLHI